MTAKRKGGRKPATPGQPRQLSIEEALEIRRLAARDGITVSNWAHKPLREHLLREQELNQDD